MKSLVLSVLSVPSVLFSQDFDREIRPLLKERCAQCHGPEKQKADLRLDAKPHAFKGGESGTVIVPAKSSASPLFQRITASGDERMPPKGEPLTADQIAKIKAWIDSGAIWPENADDKAAAVDERANHWAYRPLPPHNPSATIDSFIEAKLHEKGLSMSPRADDRTLIPRAHFVVTGLPPSDMSDTSGLSDKNYRQLIDTLLSSRHYGEKWARHWLDVVRFADSNGFETNHERPHAWRYRDYVIDAFNADKPYDRFMFEQIAGDTCAADVATGFIVGGPMDRVKGQDKNLQLMQRADELSDMVNTAGTTFLATTMICAKCHNHKFDPVTQTDFYAMQAIFSGVQHGDRPIKDSRYAAQEKKADELRQKLAPVTTKLAEYQPKAVLGRRVTIGEEEATFLKTPQGVKATEYDPGTEPGQLSDPGDAHRFPNIGESYRYFVEPAGTDCVAWTPKRSGKHRIWVSWGVWTTHAPDARFILETNGKQTEIGTINQRQFADGKPAISGKKRWSGLKSLGEHELAENSRILLRMGTTSAPMAADILLLEDLSAETHASSITHLSPHIRPPVSHTANTDLFATTTAKHLRFTILDSFSNNACIDELEIFGPSGENVALKAKTTSGGDYGPSPIHKLEHINDGNYGNSRSWIAKEKTGWVQFDFAQPREVSRVVWSRDRSTSGRAYEDRLATAYRIEVSSDAKTWKTVASFADRLSARFNRKIKAIPSSLNAPADLVAKVDALQKELQSFTEPPMAYAGTFKQPEPTHRLHRGDHMSPREVVAPDALSVFKNQLGSLKLPPDAPEQQRRLAFAKWLTDPRNPLPARVMVNRIWHYIFGTGLVATPSDFGHMGFKPTHPELLDWLANEFIKSGWSVKHIQRLILTSRTFQQSSFVPSDPSALSKDATNTLLWRFSPRRLDAEMIRDSILAATGSLDLTPGGPGFLLFEPNANYARNWVPQTVSFDRDDYRRMIYALKLRMEPDAIFAAFDAPDGGQVCPSRPRSTTPLQALNLFNSSFLLEQADKLAAKAKTIPQAYQLVYQRQPSKDELTAAEAFVMQEGLQAFCRALLNSNEFLFLE